MAFGTSLILYVQKTDDVPRFLPRRRPHHAPSQPKIFTENRCNALRSLRPILTKRATTGIGRSIVHSFSTPSACQIGFHGPSAFDETQTANVLARSCASSRRFMISSR